MIRFSGRGILLDIEGTTSSVRFVYDVMFPFIRRELDRFLRQHWGSPELNAVGDLLARDANFDAGEIQTSALTHSLTLEFVRCEVLRQMDADAKTTGLKSLQGMIWQVGFESGELAAHVYADVPPALVRWNRLGLDVRIYSSGSVLAQKLFFEHTECGNLLPHFRGHYDTTIGPKKNRASYDRIAADMGVAPSEILFLSDVAGELDAAREAGFQTGLCQRPGNASPPARHTHPAIVTFNEIEIEACR